MMKMNSRLEGRMVCKRAFEETCDRKEAGAAFIDVGRELSRPAELISHGGACVSATRAQQFLYHLWRWELKKG
jgi:hypothetical protein